MLPSGEIGGVFRVEDGDDSTFLTLLSVPAAASRTCVGMDVVSQGSGANADVAVTSGLFEEQGRGLCHKSPSSTACRRRR